MGYVAPILSLVGTGVQAYGQYRGGKNASDTYKYNQTMAKYRSKYAKDRGELEVKLFERDLGKAISRRRAIVGKSGFAESGSNLEVLETMREEGEFDADIIRYNAELEAWSANEQKDLLGTQADQFYNAGLLASGTTLMNNASRFDWKNAFKPRGTATSYNPTRFGVRPGV